MFLPTNPSEPRRKARLLIASATYAVEENRKKLDFLAQTFALTCVTTESARSFGLTTRVREQTSPENYRLVDLPAIGAVSSSTRFLLRGLGRIVRTFQPEIVLVEAEPWSFLRWQAWWCHRRHSPHALFGEFTWENLRRPGWKGRVLARVYRAAVATGDFVVAGNQEAGQIFSTAGLHQARLLVSPQMGVDETRFVPVDDRRRSEGRRNASIPPDCFLVGFCGRLEEMKGVRELVAAVSRLRDLMPTRNVRLAILGEGSLRAELVTQRTAGANWLHLLPPLPHERVPEFMALLDLFALPSKEWHAGSERWKEQFGHVLIEAMASGVLCIGSDSGAIPEVIGEPNWIVPAGNEVALAEGIERVLKLDQAKLADCRRAMRQRVLAHFTNQTVAENLARFLLRRQRAERRSVLWIDPNLLLSSPSMKQLIYAAPHLLAFGWELRAWCFEHEEPPLLSAAVQIQRLRRLPLLRGPLSLWNFFIVANLRGLRERLVRGHSPAAVTHTIGGLYLLAKISSIQFVNAVWLQRQLELGIHSWREAAGWLISAGGALMDRLQFRNPRCQLFLPVSDSIAREVRTRCHATAKIETLPNTYDSTRFNAQTRQIWREPMREKLGLSPEDVVFAFVSQGHYRRKGFWLAVEALDRVRVSRKVVTIPQDSDLKFLVVGGTERTLGRLQNELSEHVADWRSWIVFTGNQPAVEQYLSAADAFLFPSYFEAFCVAEIEADALGLPLLLTPHHGSEMILEDGVNGRLLNFDPEQMARQLTEFVSSAQTGKLAPQNAITNSHRSRRGAVTRTDYAERLDRCYRSLAALRVGSVAAGIARRAGELKG